MNNPQKYLKRSCFHPPVIRLVLPNKSSNGPSFLRLRPATEQSSARAHVCHDSIIEAVELQNSDLLEDRAVPLGRGERRRACHDQELKHV